MADPGSMFSLQQQVRQNQEELQDFLRDLNSWEDKIKKKDQELSVNKEGSSDKKNLPPVRNRPIKQTKEEIKKPTNKQSDKRTESSRISSYDYRSWDKFNVDEALAHVSDEEKGSTRDETNTADTAYTEESEEENEEILLQKAQYQKNKGNELFKIGKYEEATKCYTLGIQADPNNAILYANRAMALLKLKRYSEAEKDCTSSIAIDKSYTKAYSRRGTARMSLQRLNDAMDDFKEVLKIEPGNKLAVNELQKIKSKVLNVKSDGKSNNEIQKQKTAKIKKEEPLRRIPIEEIGSDEEIVVDQPQENQDTVGKSIQSNNDHENKIAKESESITEIISKVPVVPLRTKTFKVPTSSIQFESDWKEICHSSQLLYEYLQVIEPKLYPRLFQESLDSEKFIKMMNVFLNYYLPNNRSVIEELLSLSKVKRFSIVLLFLSGDEKKIVADLFKQIQQSVEEISTAKVTMKDIKQLASTYNAKL
ncbi:RNA polymerase II-associated protein 3 [Trichoplax sp. H2]|nr:RNA polymerase II-associated protein 3 [Trichoplax sp. H2]|eukprot:RDD43799.1 RNA polymerase II-associated protein 3 [Trichoplax sp. H2]